MDDCIDMRVPQTVPEVMSVGVLILSYVWGWGPQISNDPHSYGDGGPHTYLDMRTWGLQNGVPMLTSSASKWS